VALIATAGLALFVAALFQSGGTAIGGITINFLAVAIFLAALYALRTTKIDSIWLILVSGAVSILFHFFS
jgi:chromate transporter